MGGEEIQSQSSSDNSYDRLMGATLGDRYEVVDVLSSGGAGDVLKVRHREIGRVYAAKVLRFAASASPESLQRFKREAQLLCKLRHPNIVTVHAFGLDKEFGPYLVMDLLEGTSLTELVRSNGALPLREASKFFIEICDALSNAHHEGIVHRDVKPSNVMIVNENGDRKAVLVDFGAGKLIAECDQRLTATSAVLGTPLYMSPEQCMSKPVDKRSDVYSMGCLMYEVLTGKPPFTGESSYEVMDQHLKMMPPPPSVANPGMQIPTQLDEVISIALQKDPANRFDTLTKIKERIEACLKNPVYAKPIRKPAANPKTAIAFGKRSIILATLAVVSVGLLIGTALSLRKHEPTPVEDRASVGQLSDQVDGLIKQRRYDQALELSERITDRLSREPARRSVVEAWTTKGVIYELNNDPHLAVKALLRALQIAQSAREPNWVRHINLKLGVDYSLAEDVRSSRKYLLEARKEIQFFTPVDRWAILHRLSVDEMVLGNPQAAMSAIQESIKVAKDSTTESDVEVTPTQLSVSYSTMASIAIELGHKKDALIFANQSIDTAQKAGLSPPLESYASLAAALFNNGRVNEARSMKKHVLEQLALMNVSNVEMQQKKTYIANQLDTVR